MQSIFTLKFIYLPCVNAAHAAEILKLYAYQASSFFQ